ncbi:hypothetical protein CHS0354_023707 [Potamilus streckersoni]|uniref:Uncharacterized protein n=1 Tax=Potamilus streckersoni TaxID=2493646 RepID=A0AAE0RZ37_9BIVA|nr:hypothetical protein CHS0354_023707 [Potamilus streckersoni]
MSTTLITNNPLITDQTSNKASFGLFFCASGIGSSTMLGWVSAIPNGSDTKPNGSDTKPNGSDTKPNGSDTKPNGSDTKPNGSDTKPNGSDTKPNGSDTKPNGSDTKPNGSDTKPNGSDTKPNGSDTKPNGFNVEKKKMIKTNLLHIPLADFLHLAGEIITKMTENASLFPNLPVQLKQVTAERDAFRDVFNSSEHVGRTGELHNTRKALEESLRKNGKYVNDIANGNEEILEKSGYPLAKEPSPHGDIPAPTEAGVSLNPDGGFDIWATLVDKRYNGVLFAFTEVSNPDDDPATWRTHYAPIPDTTIRSGYTKGKEYKFAVTFLGSSETLHWFKLSKTLFAS